MNSSNSLAALASEALKSNKALADALASSTDQSCSDRNKTVANALEAPVDLDALLRPSAITPTSNGTEVANGPFGSTLQSGPWNVTVTDGLTIDDCASILTADALTLLRADEGLSIAQLESTEHQYMMSLLLKKEQDNISKRLEGRPPVFTCGTADKTPRMNATASAGARTSGHGLQSLKVGGFLDDFTIYFWRNGASVKFYIDGETFRSQEEFSQTEGAFAVAAKSWSAILPQGTEFRRVYSREESDYTVKFQTASPSSRTLASASPPAYYTLGENNITVYPFGLAPQNLDILPNVFAHEIGHVVGLRHSFAQEQEAQNESGSYGDDPSSVMSYTFPPIINVNDIRNTRTLYNVCIDGRSYYLSFRGQQLVFKHVRVDP